MLWLSPRPAYTWTTSSCGRAGVLLTETPKWYYGNQKVIVGRHNNLDTWSSQHQGAHIPRHYDECQWVPDGSVQARATTQGQLGPQAASVTESGEKSLHCLPTGDKPTVFWLFSEFSHETREVAQCESFVWRLTCVLFYSVELGVELRPRLPADSAVCRSSKRSDSRLLCRLSTDLMEFLIYTSNIRFFYKSADISVIWFLKKLLYIVI